MRRRDLSLVDLPGGGRLVIACDAAGGVGPKPGDAVKASGYVVGRFTARVPLMEVLAAGAEPLHLVNTACVEPEPTGRAILQGICDEAALAGLTAGQINGSFEKNLPTVQTGLGVTVVGYLSPGRHLRRASPGDLVVAVGRPKVGPEVRPDDPELPDLPLVRRLAADPLVHDLLPVGSRGIGPETVDLASSAGLAVDWAPDEEGFPRGKSAGPATCLLVAAAPRALPGLALSLTRPWAVVAQLSSQFYSS
ncbi:hypothetical protein J2Z79_001845 [Symbiobacterium terraclitae]|uniref:PurM-like N-terminal domain-containing protein n=1 Tax=Symbiobacterium terraclitae TaxID=557451 RepID=A0ABS4JSB9_9FIRM|nr:hypothetical protein [Symbiobacterium terraclitae]MBP2018434.1 hypothetical protein [Symbiobacterium terraclitae]